MFTNFVRHSIEPLEARIAPAALLPSTDDKYVQATFNGAVEVFEGQVVNTTGDANSGRYLLFMEKGNALVFFSDLNNNREVDFNEITGISAGDGSRIVLFADVHGDIVTNLKETKATVTGTDGLPVVFTDLSLSDSDNNAATDDLITPGDGRVVLNKTIEKIEIRTLRTTDIGDQNADGTIDEADVVLRQAPTTFSIFGNIYAGAGFGAEDGGLVIDTTGATNFGFETIPMIGSIKTGTAVSGQFFSFGVGRGDNLAGTIIPFVPLSGQAGADIIGVSAADPTMRFNLNGLYAGDGGTGARGGNIVNVAITGDDTGGYDVVAGNGGRGTVGGVGGSIINFSDLGSQTSQVFIRSGDGGVGTAGSGGNGGTFSFENFNLRGDVNVKLGDGGNGFTSGGTGASLVKGNFSQPNSTSYIPASATGTTHLPTTEGWQQGPGSYKPRIGEGGVVELDQETGELKDSMRVDFDKDGLGDFVYTTSGTSQLVVALGNGQTFYLSGARNAEAMTVADLNGDGVLDIAVGSSDEGSHSGVVVFLGKFEHIGSGDLTGSEDLNNNNVNDFLGFSDARYSALPQLQTLDPLVYGAGFGPYWESPHQISSIVAGDFDGNGIPELAVVVTYYTFKTDPDGVTIGLERPWQVLMFLTADVEDDDLIDDGDPLTEDDRRILTGQFYADFGSKGTTSGGVVTPPQPRTPFYEIGDRSREAFSSEGVPSVQIEASALSSSSTYDVLFLGILGAREVTTIDYSNGAGNQEPIPAGTYALGEVDTDRLLAEPGNAHRTPERVTLQSFAVFDYDADGIADLGVASSTPALFMVGVKGDGSGAGTQSSGDGADNSGNYMGDRGYAGDVADEIISIRAYDLDGDGSADDLAVYGVKNGARRVYEFQYQEGVLNPNTPVDSATQTTGAILTGISTPVPFILTINPYTSPSAFAVYYPVADDPLEEPSFVFGDSGRRDFAFTNRLELLLEGIDLPYAPFSNIGFSLTAGDGGDAVVGDGGKGGSLGGGSALKPVTQTIVDAEGNEIEVTVNDLVGSLNLRMAGGVSLIAGSGGDGFGNGGAGGDVTGVTVRQRADNTDVNTSITTGSGGRGVAGKGGSGGNFLGSSIDGFETTITTGFGGQGDIGGNGGNVLGNGTIVYDAEVSRLSIQTGFGGAGASRGGSGGSITNFIPVMGLVDDVDVLGSLSYITGDGGNSVSGNGGNGGNISKSSPRLNAYVEEFVILQAGNGGFGIKGGNGGSVADIIVRPDTNSSQPGLFVLLAGHGGAGLAGKGGEGGDVQNIRVPSSGLESFNRVLAGNGGSSAAGKGGNGGDIVGVSTGSVDASVVVASGAGGHGLNKGGKGGNVANLTLNIGGASTEAKGLVIAGAGGDAFAFVPNPNDPSADQGQKAFGGTIGRGGAGGSINGVFQNGNQSAHMDLIAGDGGSTINYGTTRDSRAYVGDGGSIRNILLSGNVGNIAADLPQTVGLDENVEIKGYNNLLGGETMARYIEDKLRFSTETLTDGDGNVGIVVGAAGRNKSVALDPTKPTEYTTLPSIGGRNGSLINVQVNNLMAAVAGSVDRIAEIQVIRGLVVVNGVVGADKGSFEQPGINPALPDPVTGEMNKGFGTVGSDTRDYLGTDLNTLTNTRGPVLDGALIDGAVVAKVVLDSNGRPVKIPGRVF